MRKDWINYNKLILNKESVYCDLKIKRTGRRSFKKFLNSVESDHFTKENSLKLSREMVKTCSPRFNLLKKQNGEYLEYVVMWNCQSKKNQLL